MEEYKKSFILYADIIHVVRKLSKQDAGELFLHILRYVNDEKPATDNVIVDLAFEPIKQQLRRDFKKWKSLKEKRTESGRIGGLKSGIARKQNLPTETHASMAKHIQANQAVTENATATVTENGTDILLEKETKMPINISTSTLPPSLSDIQAYCLVRGNAVDATKFFDFYQSKGWMVGKNKMKDWQASVRTWENSSKTKAYTHPASNYKQENFEHDSRFGQ